MLRNYEADNRDELAYCATSKASTAKHMCKNKGGKISVVYCPKETAIRFFVKDSKSKDCLVFKPIEIHLPLIPDSLQGFFRVFKYNLKNLKFVKMES